MKETYNFRRGEEVLLPKARPSYNCASSERLGAACYGVWFLGILGLGYRHFNFKTKTNICGYVGIKFLIHR